MAGVEHCFLSAGDILPRWREAFPQAKFYAFDRVPASAGRAAMAWIRLPAGRAPAAVLAEVRDAMAGAQCIVLSDQPNDDEALACFAAAAKGYCNSHAAPALLRQVAGVVSQGGLWIGESLMQRLLSATSRISLPPTGGVASDWGSGLTEREREVALAVAGGASNKEIARHLGITERTIKAHVGAILEKLGVRDRLQLALRVGGRRSD